MIERRALWAAEDAARELPNVPLEGCTPARPALRRAWVAEVRVVTRGGGLSPQRLRPTCLRSSIGLMQMYAP